MTTPHTVVRNTHFDMMMRRILQIENYVLGVLTVKWKDTLRRNMVFIKTPYSCHVKYTFNFNIADIICHNRICITAECVLNVFPHSLPLVQEIKSFAM